ncbi:MAG: TonB-dependent receptor [Mucilaginibacter polytrichastri]|nr:TonB-dependent receptor [Mucilaginibacter polytrichastri]
MIKKRTSGRRWLMLFSFLMMAWITPLQAQQTVRGRVKDKSGPMPGVSVMMQGQQTGTTTDAEGRFSISAPEGASLTFSLVGYKQQVVKLTGQPSYTITLQEDVQQLQDVVVVGYTTKAKEALVSSVSTVSAKQLTDVTSNNTATLLQGKAAGVTVSSGSGAPGSQPNITIRGTGTITANAAPLTVVDGLIGGTANPTDIESVSVLKDAAATGLYGSRAANGVIVITTKNGKAGKTRIDYNGTVGISSVSQGNFGLMNGQQFTDYTRYLYTNDYTGKRQGYIADLEQTTPNPTQQQIDDYLTANEFPLTTDAYLSNYIPASPGNTNWRDLAFRNALTTNHAIGLSGGNEKTTFYLGSNYYKEQGTIINTDYENINFRLNLEHKISDKFTITARANAGFNSNTADPSGALYQAYTNVPWDSPYAADGSIRYVDQNTADWYGRDKSNFLYVSQYDFNRTRGQNFLGDIKLSYQITDWLKFASSNRYTTTNGRIEAYTDKRTPSGAPNNGALSNDYTYTKSFITSDLFTASHSFGKHTLSGIAGFEYQQNYIDGMSGTGYGIQPGLEILDVISTPFALGGYKSENRFVSQLFSGDYSYDNRYFATVSLRNDGSSKFGANRRYGLFYSVGGGWIVSNEKFFESNVINNLKIRGSYGVTGNIPTADYGQIDLYEFTVQYGGIPGGFPRRLPNTDLTWETPTTINLGANIGLFKNRIDFSFDIYQRTNKDLIQDVPLSSATGFYFATKNIGSVRNRGIDLELHTKNLTGAFEWSSDFNISFNKNRILKLNDGEPIDNGSKFLTEGRDINSWYLREWAGVDPANGNPLWKTAQYDDAGNFVKDTVTSSYNSAERRFVGTSTPKFAGGFGNNFSYKNFSLSAFINFVYGNKVYQYDRELFDADGAYPQYNSMTLQPGWSRWENPGDIATHPKAVLNGNLLSNKPSSRYLEDGSYIRLRNVTLGYDLPKKWFGKGVSNLRVYVSADNLVTITGYSGLDPEVDYSDGTSAIRYPLSRKVLFGVNLSL